MSLSLTSPAFAHGDTIPREHTCEGANRSPALSWSGVPDGARSLLLVCGDPDAPGGVFHHWCVHDLAADSTGLDAGFDAASRPTAFRQAVNDFGKPGYAGPCPPRGDRPHRYVFRLSALVGRIEAGPAARCAEVQRLARPMEIASAELIGYYGRR